jgi:hypothetical protein
VEKLTKKPENKPKTPRIIIEHKEDGVHLRVDHSFSKYHAMWMLAQASITMIEKELTPPEGETDEPVQELPSTTPKDAEANNVH